MVTVEAPPEIINDSSEELDVEEWGTGDAVMSADEGEWLMIDDEQLITDVEEWA